MSLEAWTVQTALPTASSGTTDLAHGSITTVPVAALHVTCNGLVNGTANNVGKIGFGISDGTDDRYSCIGMQHGVTPTDTNHRNGTDACIAALFAASAVVDGQVSHNSFIAGGQRVNNDNGFGAANLTNSMFFSCDNAKVLTATLDATVDTAVNVDPGFAWDCLIVFGCPKASTGSGIEAEIYVGFYDKTNQGSVIFNSDAGDAAGDPSCRISTTYCGGELALGTGTLDYGILASTGAGTSCDLTPKNAGGDTDAVFCLFLGWDSAEGVSVFSWDSPTATGADAQTGLGFEPQALLSLFSFLAAYDTSEADADAGGFAVAMATSADEFVNGFSDDFNANTTNTQSLSDSNSLTVDTDTGAAGYTGSLTSLDADGFTHNFTATQGAANKMLTLAFEVAAVASGSPTPHLRERLFI